MNSSNINGNLQEPPSFNPQTNRAFLYADALFDTMVYRANSLVFLEEHYFRLLASMRQLRMEIPDFFTQDYWEKEIVKTIEHNKLTSARVRTTVFRNALGLFTPDSSAISFVIQVTDLPISKTDIAILGLYKDHLLNTNSIDNIKTTNRIYNVLAGIYAKENQFDNCVLINNNRQVAEALNANIFVVKGLSIQTPPLTSGCIDGVVRQKIIDFLKKDKTYQVKEVIMTPFDLQQADEVFLSNSVVGIQSVMQYKKKHFNNEVASYLRAVICIK